MLKPKMRHTAILALAFAVVFLVGMVAAVLLIGSQNIPSISPTAAMALNCDSLSPSTANVTPGLNLKIAFTCGSGMALSVSASASFTPTFVKSAGYANTTLVPQGTSVAATCGLTAGAIEMSTGVPVTIGQGSYYYCFDVVDAPPGGLSGFSVSWSQ